MSFPTRSMSPFLPPLVKTTPPASTLPAASNVPAVEAVAEPGLPSAETGNPLISAGERFRANLPIVPLNATAFFEARRGLTDLRIQNSENPQAWKEVIEKIEAAMPSFDPAVVPALRRGEASEVSLVEAWSRIADLRSEILEMIEALLEITARKHSLISESYKTLNTLSDLIGKKAKDFKHRLKNGESPSVEDWQDFVASLEDYWQKPELTPEAIGAAFVEEYNQAKTAWENLKVLFATDKASTVEAMISVSKQFNAVARAIDGDPVKVETQKRLNQILTTITPVLDQSLASLIATENELLSWSVFWAVKRYASDDPRLTEALCNLVERHLVDVAQDSLLLSQLPRGLQLNAFKVKASEREFLSRAIRGKDDQIEMIPLYVRKADQDDISYINAKTPPRFYDVKRKTAVTYSWAEGVENPRHMLVTETDEGTLFLTHGTSAFYSGSSALLGVADALGWIPDGKGKRRVYGTFAHDLPEHGYGATINLQSADATTELGQHFWSQMDAHLVMLGEFGKGVIPFGRSFGANSALDIPLRLPGKSKGVWAMSPYRAGWVPYTMAALDKHQIALNERGDKWSSFVETWKFEDPSTTGQHNQPVLITYSPHDIEYPPDELRRYWIDRFGGVSGYLICVFPGGAHNLFDNKNPAVSAGVRRIGHWWMKEVLKGNPDPQVPSELTSELNAILNERARQRVWRSALLALESSEEIAADADPFARILAQKPEMVLLGREILAAKGNKEAEKRLRDFVFKDQLPANFDSQATKALSQLIREEADNDQVSLSGNVLTFGRDY